MAENNSCFKCGDYAAEVGCELCQIDFSESQGRAPELMPGEFDEGMIYMHKIWARGLKTLMEIEVIERFGPFATVKIDGHLYDFAAVIKTGEVELLKLPKGWPCYEDKIFPYLVKSNVAEN